MQKSQKQYLEVTLELNGLGLQSTEEISHFLGELFPVNHRGEVLGKCRVIDIEEKIITAIEEN
ncbi:hypothetical protein P4V41_07615 [Fictibacillus nanhaiensis]|uniref:hypothetical protein n=1 Tax=Fictibacillus nanhaiensis TaxID=742169 RepID=UPI002E23B00B|nr:hypothetical protein [Fictibacillus nanhaiensis]